MNKYQYVGSCHCRNITFEMELTTQLDLYSPRACDCNFCIKQSAAYISDKNGSLAISIKQASKLNRYKQGDRIADFLICKVCGILIGVFYESQENLYATINSRTLD